VGHSSFNQLSRLTKAATIALPLACLIPLGQPVDLPPRSAQFPRLLEQLKAHVERVDRQSAQLPAPEFPTGKDWFNSPPLTFSKQLAGKITVLDFWTYCCINCIHILPDLAELEERYAGYPVAFVGVHSAKFDNEKVSENIRDAVLRYEIAHPVVNDDTMQLWKRIGVRSWPSMAVVGPKGNLLLLVSGEGNKEVIDACITAALAFYPKNIFRHDPVPMSPEKDKQRIDSPLRYPGKLAIDTEGERLFISDSNHHRIVVTDLDGTFIDTIGSGRIGLADGGYDEARFFRLQGLAYLDGSLYVADAENHALRVVDLKARRVSTLVGNGMQGRDYQGGKGGREQPISTPWDVLVEDDQVFIAMAGTHQIWSYDLKQKIAKNYSGNGSEQNLNRTDRLLAAWAQPSGLAVGNGELFVADSESSTVRAIHLKSGATRTIAGGENAQPRNLFAFGDKDGIGEQARMQHVLGVQWWAKENRVIVADTYNHRLKLLDPKTGESKRWVGSGKPGLRDGAGLEAQFSEPSGFALGPKAKRLFVADTNNHAIRVVDLGSLTVTTLKLTGVPEASEPVAPRSLRLADLPGTPTVRTEPLRLARGQTGTLTLSLKLPAGHHFTDDAGSRWQVIADEQSPLAIDEAKAAGALKENDAIDIPVKLKDDANGGLLRVEAIAYFCEEDGPCQISGVLFEVPIAPGQAGAKPVELRHTFSSQAGPFALPPSGER